MKLSKPTPGQSRLNLPSPGKEKEEEGKKGGGIGRQAVRQVGR